MIYFILLWTVLVIAGYPIGLAAIDRLTLDSFGQQSYAAERSISDRFIASTWLGILILAAFLLAISLILPLSPLVGAGTVVFSVGLSLLSSKTRAEINCFRAKLSKPILLGTALLAAIIALLTTYEVTWIESGFYHYSSIRWLSEFGAVPGTVLILPNFGIISSWFALNAPLNGSFVNFQAGAVTNGFILFLSALHAVISLSHILAHRGNLSDYFAVSFYSLFFLYTASSAEMQSVVVSPSPDLPVALLVGLVSWGMLIAVEPKTTAASSPILPDAIPLLLAIGAVTIKLSALPLVLVAGLFYLWQTKFRVRYLWLGILLSSLLLLPIVPVGLKISGCPLYPSPSFCQDVPWSQPIAETQKFADNTQDAAKVAGVTGANRNDPVWVFTQWWKARTLNKVMAVLGVVSCLCLVYLCWVAAIAKLNDILWVVAVGIVGIIFIALKGPVIRLGLGYFLILPSISVAAYAYRRNWGTGIRYIWENLGKWHQLRWLALGALTTVIALGFGYGELSSRWLVPPPVSSSSFITKQVNDIKYFAPQKGPCWASALPCSMPKWEIKAKLRDPALGIKGGFVRSSVGASASK